jgi:hypothetical protein
MLLLHMYGVRLLLLLFITECSTTGTQCTPWTNYLLVHDVQALVACARSTSIDKYLHSLFEPTVGQYSCEDENELPTVHTSVQT